VTGPQHRCIGESILSTIGAHGIAGLTGEPTPEFTIAAMQVAADCVPELMTVMFSEQFESSGFSERNATCLAERMVADPALLTVVLETGLAGSDELPPAMVDALTACA
jgi:hypothetical protein